MLNSNYQICTNCVMDTSDLEINFDRNGVCNHCNNFKTIHEKNVFSGNEGKVLLEEIIEQIKATGRGKEYDCILGLSGGIDSTYVAYLAKRYGLNPLVVHLDNGWNSELAVDNISKCIRALGFDLYTHVIDWEEFKDLQMAYLKASVIDIEAITDHAIRAIMYKVAAKHKVKYIINGNNIVTEAILPKSWIFNKSDAENIKSIHKSFGHVPLKSFPLMDKWKKQYYFKVLKIKNISILNYVPYVKKEIQKILTKELGWRDYGGKHYESVFTRFYQGYILPNKFKIDKRRAHLSTLICSGQLIREVAIAELELPGYDQELLIVDMEFVLKKFDMSASEFKNIMATPVRNHSDYATEGSIYSHYPGLKLIRPLVNLLQGSNNTNPS